MKIKITTGFGQDEKFTIDGQEAHKAYYLFNNPDKRGTFDNGVAIIGKNIHTIAPDRNGSMGWNDTHKLDDDDWNDIRRHGVDVKVNERLYNAKKIAKMVKNENSPLLRMELSEAINSLPEYANQDLTRYLFKHTLEII